MRKELAFYPKNCSHLKAVEKECALTPEVCFKFKNQFQDQLCLLQANQELKIFAFGNLIYNFKIIIEQANPQNYEDKYFKNLELTNFSKLIKISQYKNNATLQYIIKQIAKTDKQLIFELSFEQIYSFQIQDIKIQSTANYYVTLSSFESPLSICNFEFTPEIIYLKLQNQNYENFEDNTNDTLANVSKILYYIVYGLCFITLFFPGWISPLIFMAIQYMELAKFINMDYPSNLEDYFLKEFDKFSFLKSTFENIATIGELGQVKGKFSFYKISPLICNNISEEILILFSLIVIAFILYLILNYSSFAQTFLKQRSLIIKIPFTFFMMNFIKINLFIWINLLFQTFTKSYFGLMNYCFAIFLKALTILFYSYLLKINTILKTDEKYGFEFLLQELNLNTLFQRNFVLCYLLQLELVTFIIVYFSEQEDQQLLFLTTINCFFLALYSLTSPIKNYCKSFVIYLNQIILFAFFLAVQIINFSTQKKGFAFGKSIIIISIIQKIFNLLSIFPIFIKFRRSTIKVQDQHLNNKIRVGNQSPPFDNIKLLKLKEFK